MNTYNEKQSREEFRAMCLELRLRTKQDSDGSPIAITRSRKNPLDHIYEGFTDSYGVSITRTTKKQLTYAIKELIKNGCFELQRGDKEANLKFPKSIVEMVARHLKIQKGAQRGSHSSFILHP